MDLIPRRYARYYLENAPSLLWLLLLNFVTILVGIEFYLPQMRDIYPLLWPFLTDSPGATFLMLASLLTLVPNLGNRLEDAPQNRPLAYLHTFAFVWLVKYGIWTAVALNLGFGLYFPDLYGYFGIIAVHLLFVVEAFLIPHYGRTTKGALGTVLVVALLDDVLDYGFGFYPHLKYQPGLALPTITVLLTFATVGLVYLLFDRLDDADTAAVGSTP